MITNTSKRLLRICCTSISTTRSTRRIYRNHHVSSLDLRQRHIQRSLSSTTTSTDHFANLEQASRTVILEKHAERAEELLWQWYTLLPTLDTEQMDQAIDRMDDLYQQLILLLEQKQQQQKTTTTTFNNLDHKTFRYMLQTYSHFQPNGPKALSILESWNQIWIGDIERSPTLEDYHSLLKAYALVQQENNNKVKATTTNDGIIMEGSQVALEVIQQLDQWGYTMRPTLLSYSLAICCITNGFFQLDHSQNLGSLHQTFQTTIIKQFLQEWEHDKKDTEFHHNHDDDKETLYWVTMAAGSIIRYCTECPSNLYPDKTIRWVLSNHGFLQQYLSWSHQYHHHHHHHNAATTTTFTTTTDANETDNVMDIQHERYQRWKQNLHTTILSFFKLIERMSTWNDDDRIQIDPKILSVTMNDALQLVEQIQYSPIHTEHYYRAIKAAKRNNFTMDDDMVSDWIIRMQTNHSKFSANESLDPTEQTKVWNCLMMTYHELQNYDEVLRIWQTMGRIPHLRKDSISFAIILKSLAKQGTFKAAEKAHSIWRKMVSADPTKRYVHPTSLHYAHVMSAWSNTRDPRAYSFCQEVMDHLKQESIHNPEMQPSVSHYTSLIGTQGWSGRDAQSRNLVFMTINDLIQSNLELDIQAYRACFAALARTQSTDGAMIAQEMLNQSMKQGLRPDTSCFQAVMRAWGESQSSQALENCKQLLMQLESSYEASGKQPTFRPNSHCYVSMIMAAMSSSEKSGPLAESILDQMLDAAKRKMSDEPDKTVYSSVMKSYATDGDVEDVARMYKRMEKAYTDGNWSAAPDARSCAILMHAWAKSKDPQKAFHTRQLLMHMLHAYENGNLEMMPTIQCYNAALNSCAFSESNNSDIQSDIVRIGIETFADMEKYHGEASEYAFRQIFHIIGRFASNKSDRLALAGTYFQKCCQAGYVSEHIVRIIKSRIPEFYNKIPGDDLSRFPSKWTRRISQ